MCRAQRSDDSAYAGAEAGGPGGEQRSHEAIGFWGAGAPRKASLGGGTMSMATSSSLPSQASAPVPSGACRSALELVKIPGLKVDAIHAAELKRSMRALCGLQSFGFTARLWAHVVQQGPEAVMHG